MLVRIDVGDGCPLAEETEEDIEEDVPLRIDKDSAGSPVYT